MTISEPQFESLVHAHHAAVYRTAARLLAPADAEDVTQQVFARVWAGKTEPGPEPALTLRWLAARLALNALRGAKNRRRNEERRAMRTPTTVHDDHVSADERAALRRALDDLPPDLRTAVVLRYQEDLTFDDIAKALSCSLSTAHDRVRRAVGRLQQALLRGGYALVSGRLVEVLPRLDVAPLTPAGLEQTLLELPRSLPAATLTGTTASSASAITVLALVAVSVAVWIGWRGRGDGAGGAAPTVVAAPAEPAEAPEPDGRDAAAATREAQRRTPAAAGVASAPPATTDSTQDPADGRAHLFGNVFDAHDGRPLAATVHAISLRRSKKGQPFTRAAEVDASGRFTVEVPVVADGQESYTVWIRCADYAPFHLDLLLTNGATREVRAALRRFADDLLGDWQMPVSVQDETGQPVENAIVTVHRQLSADTERTQQPQEATAKTDAAGRASLRGDHHGEKVVRVRVFGRDLAPVARTLAITGAEAPELRVTLPVGLRLEGTIRAAADGEPVAFYSVEAWQDGEDVGVGFSDEQGHFTIKGLARAAVRLVGTNPPWSPFELTDVAPDTRDLDLRLKRIDDPTPRGLFGAELHGRVFAAKARTPVDVRVWDVDSVWLTGDGWRDELIDGILHPRPVQRAILGPEAEPAPAFHLTGLCPGRYAVVVRRRDYAPAFVGPIELGAGQLIADLEVALTPGGTVSGQVVDAAQQPVANAVVYLTVSEQAVAHAMEVKNSLAGGDRYARIRYVAAGTDGRFSLPHVPAGLTLRCVAVDAEQGIAMSAPLVVRDGEETSVRLQLQ